MANIKFQKTKENNEFERKLQKKKIVKKNTEHKVCGKVFKQQFAKMFISNKASGRFKPSDSSWQWELFIVQTTVRCVIWSRSTRFIFLSKHLWLYLQFSIEEEEKSKAIRISHWFSNLWNAIDWMQFKTKYYQFHYASSLSLFTSLRSHLSIYLYTFIFLSLSVGELVVKKKPFHKNVPAIRNNVYVTTGNWLYSIFHGWLLNPST